MHRVDARHTHCPEPVLRARAALQDMDEGERLEVLATDPHAELDFEVFCARTGHVLESSESREEGEFRFVIRARTQSESSP